MIQNITRLSQDKTRAGRTLLSAAVDPVIPPAPSHPPHAVILRKRRPSQSEGLPTKDLCTPFAHPNSWVAALQRRGKRTTQNPASAAQVSSIAPKLRYYLDSSDKAFCFMPAASPPKVTA
jgi:hypothetical protein